MPRIRALVRRLIEANPLLVDATIAAVVAGLSVKLVHDSYPATGPRDFDEWAVGLLLLAAIPLTFRRRAPAAVLIACEAALLVYAARGYWLGLGQFSPHIALLTVASRPRTRHWLWTLAGATVVLAGFAYANANTWNASVHTWNASDFDTVMLGAIQVAAVCAVGEMLRRFWEYRAIAAGNSEYRHGGPDEQQRAVLDERVRIARELHDVVAHHMSVIAVQAGLARYVLSSDPTTAEKALRTVAEMSSEGLAEVRRLVTVLRPDAPDNTERQTPGIDELPVMIERVGLAGIAIEFTVSGEVQPLPAGIGLCVYRVVQESLTNVIKHAPAARVTISLQYAPQQITVRITNDARGAQPNRRPTQLRQLGSGKGLTGMYERAMLYRGKLTAGSLPQGGFEVVLTLPIPALAERGAERDPTTA